MKSLFMLLGAVVMFVIYAGPLAPRSEAAISDLRIDVQCSSSFAGTAVATFTWTGNHPSALGQFLDLSRLNNGWLPGTFAAAGPFAAAQTSFVWDGLPTGMYLYARHNQYFSNGAWDTSRTYWLFTPLCGNPPAQQQTTAAAPQAPAQPQPQSPSVPAPDSNCHPSYSGGYDAETGGCIRRGNADYDCLGSGRNGPRFAGGNPTIVGEDEYGLDGTPANGIGCDTLN